MGLCVRCESGPCISPEMAASIGFGGSSKVPRGDSGEVCLGLSGSCWRVDPSVKKAYLNLAMGWRLGPSQARPGQNNMDCTRTRLLKLYLTLLSPPRWYLFFFLLSFHSLPWSFVTSKRCVQPYNLASVLSICRSYSAVESLLLLSWKSKEGQEMLIFNIVANEVCM